MKTIEIIQHFERLEIIKNMIVGQTQRVDNLKRSLAEITEIKQRGHCFEDGFIFYSTEQKTAWFEAYKKKLSISQMTLERLKSQYINELKKLN